MSEVPLYLDADDASEDSALGPQALGRPRDHVALRESKHVIERERGLY